MTEVSFCRFCDGVAHRNIESCPRISAIEYGGVEGKTILRIEFHAPQPPNLNLLKTMIGPATSKAPDDAEAAPEEVVSGNLYRRWKPH